MFAQKLKKLRQKYGMTQKQLADRIGVEKSSIAKYESDKCVMPSDDLKIKIADIFNVSLDYLMDRKENTNNEIENFDDETLEMVLVFSTLNQKGKETAMNTMRALAAYPEMIKTDEKSVSLKEA